MIIKSDKRRHVLCTHLSNDAYYSGLNSKRVQSTVIINNGWLHYLKNSVFNNLLTTLFSKINQVDSHHYVTLVQRS